MPDKREFVRNEKVIHDDLQPEVAARVSSPSELRDKSRAGGSRIGVIELVLVILYPSTLAHVRAHAGGIEPAAISRQSRFV